MQYPIIDLITSAYINNGWTGLELIYGKNLYNISAFTNITYLGVRIEKDNNNLHIYGTATGTDGIAFGDFHLQPDTYTYNSVSTGQFMQLLKGYTQLSGSVPVTFPVTSYDDIYRFRILVTNGVTYDFTISSIQIEQGTQATSYEPYAPPTTDIANRLKLPLPHYFPHPVIDALQRAAAGTQTADDTEILQHYLTPLGIGGI